MSGTTSHSSPGRWIDISMPITDGLRSNHSRPGEEVQIKYDVTPDEDPDGRKTVRRIAMRLHAGTHVDAPEHLILGGKRVDELPVETFVGRAVVADMRHRVPRTAITAADLEESVGTHLRVGDILIVRTCWNGHYGESRFYADSPFFHPDAASWVIDKAVKLVVVDFLADAVIRSDSSEADGFKHTVLAAGIPIITNADNLDAIKRDIVTLYGFPLRVVPSEAAPMRAMVWEEA